MIEWLYPVVIGVVVFFSAWVRDGAPLPGWVEDRRMLRRAAANYQAMIDARANGEIEDGRWVEVHAASAADAVGWAITRTKRDKPRTGRGMAKAAETQRRLSLELAAAEAEKKEVADALERTRQYADELRSYGPSARAERAARREASAAGFRQSQGEMRLAPWEGKPLRVDCTCDSLEAIHDVEAGPYTHWPADDAGTVTVHLLKPALGTLLREREAKELRSQGASYADVADLTLVENPVEDDDLDEYEIIEDRDMILGNPEPHFVERSHRKSVDRRNSHTEFDRAFKLYERQADADGVCDCTPERAWTGGGHVEEYHARECAWREPQGGR